MIALTLIHVFNVARVNVTNALTLIRVRNVARINVNVIFCEELRKGEDQYPKGSKTDGNF